MGNKSFEVGGTTDALLVFADIIESSKYSAVLGYTNYAERLLYFQKNFIKLGRKYFPEPKDETQEYCDVNTRGDEGTVFFAPLDSEEIPELIFRAIEFIYHLKGVLRFGISEEDDETASPRKIGVGAGIHIGKVTFAIQIEKNRSKIHHLEGFSINYAKRVESCSRLGKYSKIFLSKQAAKQLEDKPVTCSYTLSPMKGIGENIEVYEVQSGLFSGMKIELNDENDANLSKNIQFLANFPSEIEEEWMKALAISVLDCLLSKSRVKPRRAEYRKEQLKLAWFSAIENDPILLYMRAKEYEEKCEYTQQLRYLKQIVSNHPDFIHARKSLIKACWAVINNEKDEKEIVYVRDLAKEYMEKFRNLLTTEEEKGFKDLLKTISFSK